MNHANEKMLIETIDADVRRLLERCNDLMRAGDDRPLLTIVGRRLRDRLEDVAELSGSLAALISDDPAVATRAAARRAAAEPLHAPSRATGADLAHEPATIVRLKPRMPRGAWRGRGVGAVSKRHEEPNRNEDAAADAADVAAPSPSAAAPSEPVYRLRKAGASEPAAASASSPRTGGDALDRLTEFFKT